MRDIASLEERSESLGKHITFFARTRTNGYKFKTLMVLIDLRADSLPMILGSGFCKFSSKISVDSGINQLICTQDRNTISPQPAPFIEDVSLISTSVKIMGC